MHNKHSWVRCSTIPNVETAIKQLYRDDICEDPENIPTDKLCPLMYVVQVKCSMIPADSPDGGNQTRNWSYFRKVNGHNVTKETESTIDKRLYFLVTHIL